MSGILFVNSSPSTASRLSASSATSSATSDLFDQSALSTLAQRLVEAAKRAGADAADAVAVRGVSQGVEVRDGRVEESERSEGDDVGLRVLVGQRQAVVSTNDVSGDGIAKLAERAVAMGVDGLVLSNHGGRQLDGAISGLDALPDVVRAVGGRAALLVDGGVRRGSDMAKAVALGAEGVLLGRAPVYGLAAGGEKGVARALAILADELDRTLALTGCRDIAALTSDLIAPT